MKPLATLKNRKIECVVFVLFAVSLAIVSVFHEPWFDEAQAWQIARCASLKEILFEIPHYEGHPALWHLMLIIPAKLGLPYEFSMGFIAYIPILLTGWFILFCSPFSLAVRCLLPFHYFIFYQHGVVSRPYGYMTLAFVLLALTFKKRNEFPWKFMLCLLFLCMLSGFGIVLAGGIAIAWTLEICAQMGWKILKSTFVNDKRVKVLFVLLLSALILLIHIMPYSNTFAFSVKQTNPTWLCVLYSMFVMIPDSTLMNVLECEGMPRFSTFDTMQFGISVLLGVIIIGACLFYSTKRTRNYFIIPYILYTIFTSIVYFSAHHLGIIVAFFVFWLWIASDDEEKGSMFKKLKMPKISEKDKRIINSFRQIILLILLIIPCIWTIVASINDIKYDYFPSKAFADFIKEHHMENATFLTEWGEVTDNEWTDEEYFEKVNAYGLDVSVDPVAVMPYVNHNFCINLNGGRDDMAYARHQFASAEESRQVFLELKEKGAPDALIGLNDLKRIYGDAVKQNEYVRVYKISPRYISIWKHFRTFGDSFKTRYVYVRKDLLDQYGLVEIKE